ncbi:MAG: hypothetical protein ACUZ9M_00510 [Candidatus Scalindua sp.]
MKVEIIENKTDKYLELTANTEEDVKHLEEITGRSIEKFNRTSSILAIALVPFGSFKNKI